MLNHIPYGAEVIEGFRFIGDAWILYKEHEYINEKVNEAIGNTSKFFDEDIEDIRVHVLKEVAVHDSSKVYPEYPITMELIATIEINRKDNPSNNKFEFTFISQTIYYTLDPDILFSLMAPYETWVYSWYNKSGKTDLEIIADLFLSEPKENDSSDNKTLLKNVVFSDFFKEYAQDVIDDIFAEFNNYYGKTN